MKVINLGEQCGNYEDLVLQEAKKSNKFGKMYYLKNRIYLVQRNAVTDYNIWTSEKNKEKQLRLALSDALRKELDSITKAAVAQIPTLDFKEHEDDNIFIKLGKDCGSDIEVNGELQFSIQIYGCFTQNATGKAFLQMEIMEHHSTRISLLNKTGGVGGLNYIPNSIGWEATSSKF
jgi:hypothetical protein